MLRRTLVSLALLLALPAQAGGDHEHPPVKTNPVFEKLKTLVGTWESKGEHGTTKTTYRLIANGSVLVEDFMPGEAHEMQTMYALDKDGVLVTHYCASGNQPRMRATALEGNSVRFSFVDVSNLVDAKAPVMNALKVTFTDADHFSEEWNNRADGKDSTWSFALTRVK